MAISVVVLGCGYWGKNLVRIFHQLGVLEAICDPSEASWIVAAATAPGCEVLKDPEIVFSSSVSAIVIATPAETHFRLARRALESGKDVFRETACAYI
jgi:predicted dehydrogenase